MRTRLAVTVVLGALSFSAPAFCDDDDKRREEIVLAIKEKRRDDVRMLLDEALRLASAANKPQRLGRFELFRAELEADKPTDKTLEYARAAMLHLEADPAATLAAIRYHVSGAQVALAKARLGAAALHVQEARALLVKNPPPEGKAEIPPGTTNLHRDAERLAESELTLTAALRKVADEQPKSVAPGTWAALVAWASRTPLAAAGGSDEPAPPKTKLTMAGMRGGLDKSIADQEAASIAAADKRGDGMSAAATRARHSETLLRLGRAADAIKVRRDAVAFFRDKGMLKDVVDGGRWIAERFERGRREQWQARRDVVMDVERSIGGLFGPARAAAKKEYVTDYAALVDAVAGLAANPKERSITAEALEAVELVRDRSVWEEAQILADAGRWQRLGPAAADVRKGLDTAPRAAQKGERAGDAEQRAIDAILRVQSPTVKARQRAIDALVKDAAPSAEVIDPARVIMALGGRGLVVYGRLDRERYAVVGLPPGGTAKLAIVKVPSEELGAEVGALRNAMWEGADEWRPPAQALYEQLVLPVENAFGPAGTIVVPDGPLAGAAFAAFVDKKGNFLGERGPLVLAPGVRALLRAKREPVAGAPSMVLGINRFSDGSPLLPTAEKEVATVKGALEGAGRKVSLGSPGWTAAQLAAEAGPFDAIHVVTRAKLDGESPPLGGIVLATSQLAAYALGASALRANLMVLDTPSEEPPGGASVLNARALAGLAAAALVGPARTVVVAQWPEKGPANVALMGRFYERWAGGESPSAALFGAQKEMRESKLEQALLHQAGADPVADGRRFAHPRFWAPFVVWGEP